MTMTNRNMRTYLLAKCEVVRSRAGIQKLDFEATVRNGRGLADQLIQPLLRQHAVPLLVHVETAGVAGGMAVDEDTNSTRGSCRGGAHDQVQIASMKLEDDPTIGFV